LKFNSFSTLSSYPFPSREGDVLKSGSKRLELSFKNTISLQLIFLYHGFEDAYFELKEFVFPI